MQAFKHLYYCIYVSLTIAFMAALLDRVALRFPSWRTPAIAAKCNERRMADDSRDGNKSNQSVLCNVS